LVWLKYHNRLYYAIPLDADVMARYPEDNLLPGMTHAVIEDHDQDICNFFEEETTGFSDHPADMLGDTQESPEQQETKSSTDGPVVMLEKMGVSDPECDKISGRACTALALQNLHS
jgi:hypothetical protein